MMIEHVTHTNIRSEWTLYDGIDNFNDYKDLITALREAQAGDGMMLRINCPGGDASVGFMIVQAIQESKATIVCNVVYPSHSMGAIIALAGDYLIMQPHTYLMLHTYSGGTYGKSGDMIMDVKHNDEYLKGVLQDTICPFLSKSEMNKMHKGEDIYIKANDPTLPARLKRHFKDVQISQ